MLYFSLLLKKCHFSAIFGGDWSRKGNWRPKPITEEKNLIGTISIYFYLKIFNMNQINILKIFSNKGRSANSWMRQLRFDESMSDGRTDGRTDGQMDQRIDGRTDTPSYRDARTHLIMGFWMRPRIPIRGSVRRSVSRSVRRSIRRSCRCQNSTNWPKSVHNFIS